MKSITLSAVVILVSIAFALYKAAHSTIFGFDVTIFVIVFIAGVLAGRITSDLHEKPSDESKRNYTL